MLIEQVAAMSPTVDHTKELAVAAAIFLTQIAGFIGAHMKGKKRDRTLGGDLDRRFKPITDAVGSLSDEVRDIKAFVIGPDGQNGMRGELREIKDDVRGLLDRERGRRA